jgi:hypothetical protein
MSGETESSVSGWTTDTLHSHLLGLMGATKESLRQEMADSRDALNGKITDGREWARLHADDRQAAQRQQFADLRSLLDERYATQTKALDAAFKAAEQAVAVALANAEKATVKAETAADKRFESVNEFREALTDQTATFLPRIEYDTAHQALADRITANAERVAALELRLTSRLDLGQGSDEGDQHRRAESRLNISAVVAVVAVVVAIVIPLLILYATKR